VVAFCNTCFNRYFIIGLIVFPALWQATHHHSRVFLIIKPFLSFMQMQGLGVWFYINWPSRITSLLNGYEAVSLYSEQVFPVECLLGPFHTPEMRFSNIRVLYYLLLPFFGAVVAALNWFIVYCWRWCYIRRHSSLVGVRGVRYSNMMTYV